MLKGLRWQLMLLIAAGILVLVALVTRSQNTPVPQAAATPAGTATSSTGAPPATIPAVPTPLPAEVNVSTVTYREGLVGQVGRLNPLFAGLNPVDRDITSLIFEGLVTTNAYGEYAPALALDWVTSQDGLEYVFRLREDVLWQDGQPFTALDVATTVAYLQASDTPLPDEMAAFWRTVEFELLGEYTVRFRLAQPLAPFLNYLRVGVLPEHVFGGVPASQLLAHPFNLSPIGTGPYQLERIALEGDHIAAVSLRVAPVYRQRPEGQHGYSLGRVVFRLYNAQSAALDALHSGAIDALGGVASDAAAVLEQAGSARSHIGLEPTLGVILFNWESETTAAFRDARIRQAFIVGADHAGLVNRNLSGQAVAADSPFIPGSWAHSSGVRWPQYDPAGGAALLANVRFVEATPTPEAAEEGSATNGAAETPTAPPQEVLPNDGRRFTLLCADDPAIVALVNDLAAEWALLGITVQIESLPPDQLQARVESGQFETALVELTFAPSTDPDPYTFWHQGQYGAGQNYSGINDRRTSELLERARRDPNGLHRAEYYREFQQTFIDRALALPLYYPVYHYMVAARVQGVQLGYLSTPTDRLRNIQDWITGG